MAPVSDKVRDVLQRHEAFWHCGEAECPLIGTTRWPYIPLEAFDYGLPSDEGILAPDMLKVDHFLPQYEAYFACNGVLDGDLFWWATPPGAVPWLEAIVGCRVRFSKSGGSMFTEHILSDWQHLPELDSRPDHRWFMKLVEFTEGLVKLSAGRFPVSPPITRGPWDIVGGLRGMTNVYLDIYDHQSELQQLADRCADVWIAVVKHLSELIPPWQGGYVGMFGIWGPRFNPSPQNDHAVSVSPQTYREVMFPADHKTVQACSSAIFHLHSAGFHQIDVLLEVLEGHALEVNIDPSGPALDTLLPVFQGVQERRIPLLLLVNDWQQVEKLTAALSPRGLAVYYVPATGNRT